VAPPNCLRKLRAAPAAALCAALLAGCAGVTWPGMSATGAPSAARADLPWGSPPVAAAAATSAAASKPEVPAYRIGAEDALEISVWKEDALKSTTLVRPDGGITVPLAGDLGVAGLTAAQVRDELAKRLARFFPEPEVTVSVVRVASYRIYVLGRVNKPGDFMLGRTVDVLQALSLAGGMTPFAAEDGIRIIRRVDGAAVAIPFDYSRVRKGGDLSQNITLKSGDVLLVP
jgi:polysaccharide export outer membrane protein